MGLADFFQCDRVVGPGAGHKDEPGVMGNPYPYGECTWFVWLWYHTAQNMDLPGGLGNANQWIESAHAHKWAVDSDPKVGKIACWSTHYGPFGHVAVIIDVQDAKNFTVQEMNFTYMSPDNAGRIDCRKVTTAPDGLILPGGAVTQSNPTDQLANLGSALTAAGGGIAASIEKAMLQAQAEVKTAEERLLALSMMGLGAATVAGGGGLAALTMAGAGSPGAGAARLRRYTRAAGRGPQRRPGESTADAERLARLTPTERAWLSLDQRQQAEVEAGMLPTPRRRGPRPRPQKILIQHEFVGAGAHQRPRPRALPEPSSEPPF